MGMAPNVGAQRRQHSINQVPGRTGQKTIALSGRVPAQGGRDVMLGLGVGVEK